MKKLMFALAAVVVAACSQAATVSWTCSNVADAGGTKLTTGSQYVFFFDSAAGAQAAIAEIKALDGAGAAAVAAYMAGANFNDVKKATAAGNFSIGTSASLGSYTLPSNGDLGLAGGTTYYMFSVIFDTTTITDDSKFLIATGTATTTGAETLGDTSSANKSFALGSQSANTTWYQTVPEPTSGLLMIVGLAGLALRRRRA